VAAHLRLVQLLLELQFQQQQFLKPIILIVPEQFEFIESQQSEQFSEFLQRVLQLLVIIEQLGPGAEYR